MSVNIREKIRSVLNREGPARKESKFVSVLRHSRSRGSLLAAVYSKNNVIFSCSIKFLQIYNGHSRYHGAQLHVRD